MTMTRTETDSLGTIEIPADRYWGPQTERALALFRIGEARLDPGVIRATGLQKWAAAEANRRLGELPEAIAEPAMALARALNFRPRRFHDRNHAGVVARPALGGPPAQGWFS